MGLRESMNNNPAVVTGGAAVLLLIAIGILAKVLFFGGGGGGPDAYQIIYYDVANNTIKLVEKKKNDPFPNSPLDGSPDVYEATIFSCGECGEITDGMTLEQLKAAGMSVGYLQKRVPGGENSAEYDDGHMYRPLQTDNWYPAMSEQWMNIQSRLETNCPNGGYVQYCTATQPK